LAEIGTYLKLLGRKALVLWDEPVKKIVGDTVTKSIQDAGLEMIPVDFQGEATSNERARVAALARETGAEMTVGIGGGKVLDVAKAAAVDARIRMVTCPTIASNDSPTSAASVWYDENHDFVGFECWPFNPDIVLVDSQVIARAPVRAFVAGMGDALSTWVETDSAFKSRSLNLAGGLPTMAAIAIARLCYETLMEHGIEAKRALECQALTPAVEKVIEANVLLSGLGFESGGLATAHMVGNLLSNVPECKHLMHGEKVGFGVITQLCLDDDVEADEIYAIVDFEIAVGLPVTLADLNLAGASRERLKTLGDICGGEGSLCHNHTFKVTSDDVVDAMIAADALGRSRKELIGMVA
jgi:glycerol dehydrogenase